MNIQRELNNSNPEVEFTDELHAELLSMKEYVDNNPNVKERFKEREIGKLRHNCPYAILTNNEETAFGTSDSIPKEIKYRLIRREEAKNEDDYYNAKSFTLLEYYNDECTEDERELIREYLIS